MFPLELKCKSSVVVRLDSIKPLQFALSFGLDTLRYLQNYFKDTTKDQCR